MSCPRKETRKNNLRAVFAIVGLALVGTIFSALLAARLATFQATAAEANEVPNNFRSIARSRWQRTDVTVLGAQDPLPLNGVRETKSTKFDFDYLQVSSWIILAMGGATLLLLVLYNRMGGGLFRSRIKSAAVEQAAEEKAAEAMERADGSLDIDQISAMEDKREALHLLVAQCLTKVARDHGLALRHSQTAREVVSQLPSSSHQKDRLHSIVRGSEPYLFGLRQIGQAELLAFLEAAAPLFPEVGRVMGR